MNKPKLRFKKFEDDWKETRLNNLVNSFDYGLNASSKKYDGKNKYLRITDIDDGNRLFKYDDLTTPNINLTNKDNYLLQNGNVVFARTGASTGKTYLYHEEDGKVYFAGFLIRADMNELSDGNFIFDYTLTTKYDNFIKINSMRSGQPGINSKELGTLKINVPTIKEQRQIGLFFNKIDKLIELKGNKIASLERLKSGYLQKLLTDLTKNIPKLRFKGFNYDWNVKQLNNIGQFKSGYGFPDKEQGGKSGIPFFKVSDMANNKSEMKKSNNYVDEKQIINNSWKVIKPENSSIIFAKVGAALNKNRKRMVNKPFLIDNNIMAYSFDDSWSSLFGFSLFLTLFLPKYAQVGALPSFNAGDIGSINVRVPTLEEQSKIGTYMTLIDKQINLQQKELDRLKSLKKGYLQKMFI